MKRMNDLTEYKILTGDPVHCEDKLNEWKGMYDLTILRMCTKGHGHVSILLLRTIPRTDKGRAQ